MATPLVPLRFTPSALAQLDATLASLEAQLSALIELSPRERRRMPKMGALSEPFCRQTLIVLEHNPQLLPPGFDLEAFRTALLTFDQFAPRVIRVRRLCARSEDTLMGLGSDILRAALTGYALAKVAGKGAGLEELRQAMAGRYAHRRKAHSAAPPSTTAQLPGSAAEGG